MAHLTVENTADCNIKILLLLSVFFFYVDTGVTVACYIDIWVLRVQNNTNLFIYFLFLAV